MGHAVYTLSDPRAQILKTHAKSLAYQKGYDEEYEMLCSIERLAPQVFAEEKHGPKKVCANVDLFSGLIYRMLGISEDLFTPLFAIARVPGWCAHRVEEVEFANRIIRPAYKYVGQPLDYPFSFGHSLFIVIAHVCRGRCKHPPLQNTHTNTTCTSTIYSAVPAAILNKVFFFQQCKPTTAAAAISSGRPRVGPSKSTPRRQ